MNFFLAEKDGYAGDCGTTKGTDDLGKDFPKLKAFQKLLAHRQADESLRKELVNELLKVPRLQYLANLSRKGKSPLILTDGVVEDD